MKNKGLTLDFLIDELKKSNLTSTVGDYTFKQLTLKQQRKILGSNFETIEIPIKISNIYSEYLTESVICNTDVIDILKLVTIETKPFYINELRRITFGSNYYEKGEKYQMYTITQEDLEPKAKEEVIDANNKFKINIMVPTLYDDIKYNNLLLGAIAPYKKKKNSEVLGAVTDNYQIYELMKYIVSFTFDGNTYNFADYSIQDRIKFLNNLSQLTINSIKDYIKKYVRAAEEKALKCTSPVTGKEIQADINTLFFSSTIDKEDSTDEEDSEENNVNL